MGAEMNSNVVQLPHKKNHDENVVFEEAVRWIVEIDLELSSARKVDLQNWMAQSPQHRKVLLEQARLWDDLEVLSKLSQIFPYEKPTKSPKYYLIAASIFFVFLVGLLVKSARVEEPLFKTSDLDSQMLVKTYTTQKGQLEKFTLPDGSVLTLNTDSTTNIKFSKNYRNISLLQGEIYIDVAKDLSRPLNIIVGGKVIQAVGTAFNVQYFEHENIELVVSEGKVMFAEESVLKQNVNFSQAFPDTERAILLSAGDKIVTKKNQMINSSIVVQKIIDDLDINLSWLEGHITFSGEPMDVAIKKINRYLTNPIVLQGEKIKKVRVIGRYEHGSLEQFLQGLNTNFNISQQTNSHGQIVLTLKP